MGARRSTARTSSNYGFAKDGDRHITVAQDNCIDWHYRFSGNLSSFLKRKGEQWLKANPDYKVIGASYITIDFDFEQDRFFATFNGDTERVYLGRKIPKKEVA